MKEECSSCAQMKKANKELRKALQDTNTNYTEVINENLALHRKIEELEAQEQVVFKNNIHEAPAVYQEVQTPTPSHTIPAKGICERGCCSTSPSNLDHPQIGAN